MAVLSDLSVDLSGTPELQISLTFRLLHKLHFG